MNRLLSLAALLFASGWSSAQALWPTSDLQEYVDYREPAPLSAMAGESNYFKDVPYPKGVLFSTTTGSIYWFDAVRDSVTCLLPMNGYVTGLSMSADRSVYSFSLEGRPYLWRPGSPGIKLTTLGVGEPPRRGAREHTLRLNATGSMAIYTVYESNEYESYAFDYLLDLKTMALLRRADGGLDFTPDGRFVVGAGFDYDQTDSGGNAQRYWEISNFQGGSVKRENGNLNRTEGRYNLRPRWDKPEIPAWYPERQKPTSGALYDWDGLGLPPAAPFVPLNGAHVAGPEDGLDVVDEERFLQFTRRLPSGETLWQRKVNEYNGGTSLWLDDLGQTLLVLTSRPGAQDRDGRPGPRMVLRQYDWRTGEHTGTDLELPDPTASTIYEWDPGRFIAVGTAKGRLEYWFTTKKFLEGNGTTAFRGRSITSFYPSMTGSVSFDKSGQVLTFSRFPGQVGGVTSLLVRDDQKLVAAADEGGQWALWRVDDGEVLAVSRFNGSGSLDRLPIAGLIEQNFRAVVTIPKGASTYPSTSVPVTGDPR